jgi:protein-disulfide isomerase
MTARAWVARAASLSFLCAICLVACGADCPPAPSPEQQKTLLSYVQSKYRLPKTIKLTLKRAVLVPQACYWELAFEGESPIRTWDLTLYASPDFRFLSSDLFDTHRDPTEEERIAGAALMTGPTPGSTAARGPEKAAVNIAVFSDFQCPYCRSSALLLHEVLESGQDDVRVVFHHLPLSLHAWARQAAEAAACAQLQSATAFGAMHDQIFLNQASISAENAKEKLSEFAKGINGLDQVGFQQCMDNGMSLGLVLRDMQLAEKFQVTGTPTIFINGRRVQGVEHAQALRELIQAARGGTSAGATLPIGGPKGSQPSN